MATGTHGQSLGTRARSVAVGVAVAAATALSGCDGGTPADQGSEATTSAETVRSSSSSPSPSTTEQDFPDARSAGVPDGVPLTHSDGLTITEDDTVVDGQEVNGRIIVQANNVTIRNTKVTSSTDVSPLQIDENAEGTLIENVEVDNSGEPGLGILIRGDDTTVRAADIHSAEDGMRIEASNVLVEGCYIHDMQRFSGGHHDSIQIRKGDDITLTGNNLQSYKASTYDPQNAALQIGSLVGDDPISNLVVSNNLMNGGNYTINGGRSGDTDSARYTNNQFGTDYRYGIVANLQQGSIWEDSNVDHESGEPVR